MQKVIKKLKKTVESPMRWHLKAAMDKQEK